jgi:hypothetical protein
LRLDVAPPSPGGPVELPVGNSTAIQAEYEKLRWFIWSYCALRALRDPEFKRRFYAHGFTRLNVVRELTHKFGTKMVRMDRLLKTELAQALVLDTHINTTANGATVWWQAATSSTPTVPPVLSPISDIDWHSFSQPQPGTGYTVGAHKEYQIIRNMVQLRRSPTFMSDGPSRSAYIVLCCEGLSYPEKRRHFNQAKFDEYRQTADPLVQKLGYPGGITQVMTEALRKPAGTPAENVVSVLEHTYGFLKHLRPADE